MSLDYAEPSTNGHHVEHVETPRRKPKGRPAGTRNTKAATPSTPMVSAHGKSRLAFLRMLMAEKNESETALFDRLIEHEIEVRLNPKLDPVVDTKPAESDDGTAQSAES